ncbi:hypothetical protein GUITHDRAFT_77932 [Guillardia theta CCMP2712]|uniref:KN homeodomain domain-containing protein n=1 Tax=Guillardia theta (strain CCMP2712) TaxID=905079 RepID=L1IN62_GUITC|nr:hypothetical protein GUITHDRAFT_77932 [Guillardia theta CCMP2712]EKX37703.1 hypothetical protein GUITHDRAFT_77932 [Guillardia theta CCMP2712]|eukprot:XP_005824683.1 hypothetical protein GUITHDRAFT_77932 [Guillardia theta CCMP2712]
MPCQYGSKVEELQRECANKRRRANLPESAVEIFRTWFRQHAAHPYPTETEKQLKCVEQVSNWFVNVRKRYWRHNADGEHAVYS